jgi:hypothetical protein
MRVLAPESLVQSQPNITSPVLPQFLESFDPIGPVRLILASKITLDTNFFNACIVALPVVGGTSKTCWYGLECDLN